LQVARLAGVPKMVIQDARRYLGELERRDHSARPAAPQQELELAPPRDPAADSLIEELERLDADGLSPRDALALIFAFKERLRGRR
jgi:DNA mismatch repair protein MutS